MNYENSVLWNINVSSILLRLYVVLCPQEAILLHLVPFHPDVQIVRERHSVRKSRLGGVCRWESETFTLYQTNVRLHFATLS